MFCQVVSPLFQFAPPASSLCLAGNSAFHLSRVLSLLGRLAYTSCLPICCSALYYTNHRNTFHTVYKYPTAESYAFASHIPPPNQMYLQRVKGKLILSSDRDKTSVTIPVNAPEKTTFSGHRLHTVEFPATLK